MRKLVLILIISFFGVLNLSAQVNYARIDKLTYDFYTDSQWDSVLHYGLMALDADIDFLYLRMRMGIAYYEQKNFMKSSEHFKKAIEFDSSNIIAQEYLYYSYLFSGRKSDAAMRVKSLPEKLIDERNIKSRRWIETINTESSYSQADYPFEKNNENFDADIDIYAEGDIVNSINYYHIGLKHRPLPNLTIYHGPSYININKSQVVYYKDQRYEQPFSVIQKDYYIQIKYAPFDSWEITGAFHSINVQIDRMTVDSIDFENDVPVFVPFQRRVDSNYLIFGSISKQLGLFKPIVSYSFGHLNSHTQHQPSIGVLYYPKGNLDLYAQTSFTYFIQNGFTQMKSIIFEQTAGAKVFKNLWAEVKYSLGDRSNYAHTAGFVLDNKNKQISTTLQAKVIWQITNELGFMLIMNESQYTDEYRQYQSPEKDGYLFINYNFKVRSLLGSLNFKF
ncbi:MAG: hypothetical protein JEZ03_07335 [Bacteroidales bacterium]|nr:hypothetical protein [Bacteroidales bacterium]